MDNLLEGKVAIVTGSGQGVGRAIALELASHGCKVVTNNRKKGSTSDQFMQGSPEDWAKKSPEEKADIEKKLSMLNGDAETTANTIIERGGIAMPYFCDITDFDAARGLVEATVEKFGTVDIVVNVAGSFGFGSITEISEEVYDRVTGVKPKGYFNVLRFATPYMIKNGWGRIINCTSRAFWGDVIKHPEYCVANAGVVGLTRAVAMELAEYGITANAFGPWAQTRAAADLDSYSSQHQTGVAKDMALPSFEITPTPDKVAPFLAYLCTDAAKDYSGCVFTLAGNSISIHADPIIKHTMTKYSEENWTVEELIEQAPRGIFSDYRGVFV